MSEENKMRDVVDAVTGVAKAIPVYQDVVQPAAQELGKALQTVTKLVHVALAPASALIWGYDEIKDFVSTKVSQRLVNVPRENIIEPKIGIAGPVLDALRFTGHEPLLRELYANLLASSMDKSTAKGVLPAFVEIIKQLTPDEAKLVGLFIREIPYPLLDVRWEYKMPTNEKSGGCNELVNFSKLGDIAGCEFPDLVPLYIDNICRLGLADVPALFRYTGLGIYDALECDPLVQAKKDEIEKNPEWKCVFNRKGLVITQLGHQFARICVLTKI